ncbi:hypothetical protein QCA50_009174 [Cerrena zonata]|uniref:Uncharacterized protein n=1 Tax=Cerrena zonata TaxID=2478898 RepID=A0AAW0GG20_9APHY
MSLPSPRISHISRTFEWPNHLEDLTKCLHLRLPDILSSDSIDLSGTDLASAVASKSLTSLTVPVDGSHSDALSSISNLIQVVITTLRQIKQVPDTLRVLCNLLFAALGKTISENISVILNTTFSLARTEDNINAMDNGKDTLDGFALLFASLPLYDDSDVSLLEQQGAADSESESGSYILGCKGLQTSADVPVFVVADRDNIIPLMTSTVYQRYVLSIDEPLVGLELSDSGSVRVNFAWLEQDDVQLVHIVRPMHDLEASPCLGVYDLTDMTHSLALSQFIISLRAQCSTILSTIRNTQYRSLCWRLDHRYINLRKNDTATDENVNIQRWLSECSPGPEDNETNSGLDEPPTEDSSIWRLPPPPPPPNLLMRTIISHGFSALPASAFTWLLDRRVEEIPNRPPLAEMEGRSTIQKMKDSYDGYMETAVIPDWDRAETDSTLLATSPCLKPQLDKLLSIHQENLDKQRDGQRINALDATTVSILEKKLDIFLAMSLFDTQDTCSTRYAHLRQIWDFFLYYFLVENHAAGIRNDVRFNVQVQLSRNQSVDKLRDVIRDDDLHTLLDDVKPKMTRFALDTRKFHCTTYELFNYNVSSDLRTDAAYNRGIWTVWELRSMFQRDNHNFISFLWTRAESEPTSGPCEIVALRRVPTELFGRAAPFPPDQMFVCGAGNHASATHLGNKSATQSEYVELPFILGVFQRPEDQALTAFRRLCIYMTSAVDMYTHLCKPGENIPVWGIYINGKQGDILMAQRCSESDRTFIIQRGTHSFDITDPFQAMQFASFLLRIRDSPDSQPFNANHEDKLVPWPQWTRASQERIPEEFKLTMPEAVDDPDWEADIFEPEPLCYPGHDSRRE